MIGLTSTKLRIIIAAGMRILACLALLTGDAANLRADDTPKAYCQTIPEWTVEIRTNDLSSLNQRQRANIAYYLANEAQETGKIPATLRIFKDEPLWNQTLNFSLIFPYGRCPHPNRCTGTAVLPGLDKIRLQKFSYRRNLVMAPYVQSVTATNLQNISASLVLFDEKEQSFLRFYDVYQTPAIDGNGKQLRPDYLRSEYTVMMTGRERFKSSSYSACLQNVFNVRDRMPD
jgi:hypothetical protein